MTKRFQKLKPGPQVGYLVVFGAPDWTALEKAYRYELPDAARELISLATLSFTLSFPMEESAPKIGGKKDVLTEIDQLIELAEKLRAKLYPPHYWQDEYQAEHVPPLHRRLAAELELLEDQSDVQSSILRISLTGLIESGLIVIRQAREDEGAPEGTAWKGWVVWLTLIVKAFQLPHGIRRDVYRLRKDNEQTSEPSDFVTLVKALQTIVCPSYRRPHSDGSLAKAIDRARRSISVPKTLVGAGPTELKREFLSILGMRAYPREWHDGISPIEQAVKLVLGGGRPGVFPFIPAPPYTLE